MTLAYRQSQPTQPLHDPGRRRLPAPPHSTEAEESVIGALLRSRSVADDVFDRLGPADFYVPAHHKIVDAMRGLYDENQPIDTVTVVNRLHRAGHLDAAGGTGFVVGFWDAVPSAANVGYYIGVVAEHSLRRRMLEAARRITELAGDLETRGGLLPAVLERLEHIETEGLDVSGIPTGLADLDGKLGGLQPSTLVVVAGRPGMGKSALAMNIASHVAAQPGPGRLLQPRDVTHRSRLPLASRPSQSRLHAATHRHHQRSRWSRG